jgi:hypothetical protein
MEFKLGRRGTVWDDRRQKPLWFRCIAVVSYTLLFGGCAIGFVGSMYILFFVDPSQVDPSSLGRNTPLLTRLGYVGFMLVLFLVGYVLNRLAWGPFLSQFRR